ncbi:ABC transporter substrate-binding protein [Fimbriimonas ginsengisoli]|uniref:Extracellular ligand-binding receptor n=1 Tax=Fimbriimonas ginsengisoli Gsoil 348 TaxID=661478 RepID=A0A068NKM7_FIMGI|nr:ABC transporter substrate-binding protein [Fimbriimonas ginsengisoli]AIE84113.1 extracellular ligand-binding receptor [Fimbriimonas ginsengisoli Gsoil 348]
MLALLAVAVPIRIAAAFNLSGSMASVDAPGWRGMRLAAEEINRGGGVHGRRIELVLVDGKSNPQGLGRQVDRLLAKGGIDAVAGLYDSDFALPVGRAAQRHRVPFVTSGATLPGLTKKIGDYAFMACYQDDQQAAAMADFARKVLGARDVGVSTDNRYDYPRAISSGFQREFRAMGGTTSRWGGYAPEAAYFAQMPAMAGPLVKQARKGGFAGPILSGDGFDTPDLARIAGADARGVYFTTHVAYDHPEPRIRSFVNDYEKRWGHRPLSASAALAYDSLRLVADAEARRGRGSLHAALAATRGFVGVTGTISYSQGSREPHKPITIVQLVDGRPVYESEIMPGK